MKSSNLVSRYVNGLTDVLRLRGPLAADPTARVFHALLVTIFTWFGLWSIVLYPFYPDKIKFLFILPLEIALAAAMALLRLDRFRAASIVYLSGSWLYATMLLAVNTGIRSTQQVLYLTLPISAAWLLGYRAALWTTGISLAGALVFALLELRGVSFPRLITGTPLGNWATLVQACLIASVPVAHVLRSLQSALRRSRQTEEELQNYREDLELLVNQRTVELVQARDDALTANRSKSIFLAKMSHELRTPLNAILGFSGIVLRDASLSDQHRKDLAIVGTSGEHLLGLIDEVLDMAKIETSGTVLESVSFDLHKLVTETIDMLRERAQARNLDLLLDISSLAPRFVRSDAGKVRQILVNLVGNALKYTDEGSVAVRLDSRPGDASAQLMVVFEVEDTGIGISAEDQARIFDPFVQAESTTTRKGTGLGLSISNHLVQLLGGTIQVESTLGRGSRFRVELPGHAVEASEITRQTAGRKEVIGLESGQADYRVLIVEDQKENWVLLQRLLQTAGFQVQVAEDGGQAVECFSRWRPQFIWMDVRLPVISGLEAARRIRELDGGRSVKIVAVTASAFASQRQEVLSAGFDDFLRKPYRASEIFDCMARHLGLRYVYGAEQTTTEDRHARLTPDDLATLPAALRDELEKAVISLDPSKIALLVSQILEQNASIGRTLKGLSDNFAYSAILHALRSCRSKFTEAGA